MNIGARQPRQMTGQHFYHSPLFLLGLAFAVVLGLLSLPLSVPIGPMYWDVFIYFDASNRIFSGQIPIVDFFTPVGPLGYYLFAGWLWLFPDGQPALLAHWSLLALTAPLMALVVAQVDRQSRVIAFALLIPFLIFALLPFNGREFYPFPGSDAFGIYNRQVCQVLYVLVSALMFVRSPRLLVSILTITALALFFLKITGFAAAMIICLFAFAAGRLSFRQAAFSALAFLAMLAILEATTGLISIYLADILALVDENSGTLLSRFVQAASLTFGIIAPAGILSLILLVADRKKLAGRMRDLATAPGGASLAKLLDHNALWLAAIVVAGIVFESQNTGSQAMIFIWPVVLAILLRAPAMLGTPKTLIATLAVAAAAVVPVAVNPIERAARAYIGALSNVPLENQNLKTLGRVNMRPNVQERADHMIGFYATHQPYLEDLAIAKELPNPLLYSDFDFQAAHLVTTDRAITAIRALEARSGVRFETMMTLSFVNIFPYLMDRAAPLHIAIGADPFRAVPDPGSEEEIAVQNVDIALYPKCPSTVATARLLEIYAPMLRDHKKIELDACHTAYVHPRLAAKISE